MKKTLLGFFSFGLISLLFSLQPTSVFAWGYGDYRIENAIICANSISCYGDNPNIRICYGNIRFRYDVRNLTSEDVMIEAVYSGWQDEPYPLLSYPVISDIFNAPANSKVTKYKTATLDTIDSWGSGPEYSVAIGPPMGGWYGMGEMFGDWDYDIAWSGRPVPLCSSGPTPTPTPSFCPLTQQQTGFSGSGTPLINDYNTTQYKGSPQYTNFTANKNGKVSKVEIYGTLDRNIPQGGKVLQCKITVTDSTGTTTLGESATNNGAFTKGVSWMGVPFTTPVNIVNGTSYRLYCKVNNVYGGGLIYWLDNWNKRTDKTYRLYMCE